MDKYHNQACNIYTLEGIKPGKITKVSDTLARVATDDTTVIMCCNWQTVERKMTTDKLFYSC